MSLSTDYQQLVAAMDGMVAAARQRVDDCRRGREAVDDEDPSAPGGRRRRGAGRDAGAALLGSILGFNPFAAGGGAAAGAPGWNTWSGPKGGG